MKPGWENQDPGFKFTMIFSFFIALLEIHDNRTVAADTGRKS